MKTWSLPLGLCWWTQPVFGLGLSLNAVTRRMGCEPFFVGQFLCFLIHIAPKTSDYGWKFNLETGEFARIKDAD